MKTLFDLLLEPQDGKGYFPPTRESLISQAFTFVVAGVDTTSMILSFATYHILSSPDVLKNLQSELYENDKFIRDEFDWDTLRKLPYLVRFTFFYLYIGNAKLMNCLECCDQRKCTPWLSYSEDTSKGSAPRRILQVQLHTRRSM